MLFPILELVTLESNQEEGDGKDDTVPDEDPKEDLVDSSDPTLSDDWVILSRPGKEEGECKMKTSEGLTRIYNFHQQLTVTLCLIRDPTVEKTYTSINIL